MMASPVRSAGPGPDKTLTIESKRVESKQESKATELGSRALNALADSGNQSNTIKDTILHLEEVSFQDRGPIKLERPFSEKEIALIQKISSKWSISKYLSLIDLWGLEIWTNLNEIKNYLDSDIFCKDFFIGQNSILLELSCTRNPHIACVHFLDTDFKSSKTCFAISRKEWIKRLKIIKTTIIKIKSDIHNYKNLMKNPPPEVIKGRPALGFDFQRDEKTIIYLENLLDLGISLIGHPQVFEILCDRRMLHLQTTFNIPQLKSSPWQKTSEELLPYFKFQNRCIQLFEKAGVSILNINPWTSMHKDFEAFISTPHSKMQAARHMKKNFSEFFSMMTNLKSTLHHCLIHAFDGSLTHHQFCEDLKIQKLSNKSKDEFLAQLMATTISINMIVDYIEEFIEIIDLGIMVKIYPDVYVPTTRCINRFVFNLGSFYELLQRPAFIYKNLPPPSVQREWLAYEQVIFPLGKEITTLFQEQLSKNGPAFVKIFELYEEANLVMTSSIAEIMSITKAFDDLSFSLESLDQQVKIIHERHLSRINGFLASLSEQELISEQQKWIDYFQEKTLTASLELIRFYMIIQDAKAVSQLHVNLNVANSEEHLLTDVMIDFVEVTGIEKLFRDLLTPSWFLELENDPDATLDWFFEIPEPPAPVAAAAAAEPEAPVKSAAKLRRERAQKAKAKAVREESPETFRIRRGEKVRKVLKRLRERGFFQVRQNGSHTVNTTEDGKQTAIVAVGGVAHRTIPRGTSRSIEKQVNG